MSDGTSAMNKNIEHVVVIMLENRGFDTVLGYLYGPDAPPQRNIPPLGPGDKKFHGLLFEDTDALKNPTDADPLPPQPVVRATNSPGWDPGEEYEHVNVQLFSSKTPPNPATKPSMKGFFKDYSTQCKGDAEAKKQIMRLYTPADLPVLSSLARGYAVSDLWFSSVPTQTNANRAFSLCGTSLGLVDNGYLTDAKHPVKHLFQEDRFDTDTIWNVLSNNKFDDWAVFWQVNYPPTSSRPYTRNLFPRLEKIPNIDAHFRKMDEFYTLARQGKLPRYSYIEPSWGGYTHGTSVMGNEYHPPSDVTPGEHQLQQIYLALLGSGLWQKTLLVVTFDEHGGTYDHVPPGAAVPPTGLPGQRGQYGFLFDRYGVRIPTILVSPYVAPQTVFRSAGKAPYDHTSVIATLLKWLLPGVSSDAWGLGERVKNAPTFEGVLTLAEPRTDNVLAPPRAAAGTPLKFGDPFYLRHMSGDFVIGAYPGTRYYYPRLGASGAVRLDFRLGMGVVTDNSVVQVRTEEYLQPYGTTSPYFAVYPAIRNFLGAWEHDPDCYYYSTNDAENYGQQLWTVTRKDGPAGGPLRYGDRIYLASKFGKFLGQRLKRQNEYVSTAVGVDEWWSIEAGTEPRKLTPGVMQFGDLFHLRNMNGEYVTANYRKWPQLGPKNAVALQLLGGVGDITDGHTIKIKSMEQGLGASNILGAFGDSHDCYYWNDGYDANKQVWRITKVDGGDAGVRSGDKVRLTNFSYANQKLLKDPKNPTYVTTQADSSEWWTLEKP